VEKVFVKEIAVGLSLALIIFIGIMGYDLTPMLFILATAGGLYFLARVRGLVGQKSFNDAFACRGASFTDIGGQDSAIQELKEALDFICNHKDIKRLGIRPLKGILLTGPPGTGKTLMAKAAAGYTDATFISASGSEFIEMYAGVGAQRVRRLFQEARGTASRQKKNNAIIFIDEIEILGGKRGKAVGHMEYDQTLNQLLVEMDGLKVEDDIRVLLVAATNRADMLDPALLRPGRFDRRVKVDLPDKEGRLSILKLHTSNKPLADDVELELIAKETFGFSGAHLESLANEAAILAMREGCVKISQHHFSESIDKVMMGGKLDKQPSRSEMKRVAVHETGHALLGEMVRPGSVSAVTITPRGDALGYMRQAPEDDTYLHTKDYLENQIAIMLGGAVAEEVLLGNSSTGSTNDLEQAMCAADVIVRAGMSKLGVICPESLPRELKHQALTEIVQKQEQRVKEVIAKSELALNQAVELLFEKEKITGDQFRSILNKITDGVCV